jgi:hypothetical protein
MAQPSKLFHWATSGGAVVTDPPSAKQDSGFQVLSGTPEKPAMDYVNSLLSNLFSWAGYVKNITGEALTWTAVQTFSAGISLASLTLSGALSAASATLSGALTAASATLSGSLHAASAVISGSLSAASAAIGALSGATVSLTGALTAASATLSGAINAASGSVSGALHAGTLNAGTGSGTALTASGTAVFNNNIAVAAQIHQTGGAGSGGIRTENRLSGVVANIPSTGGNGSGPQNRQDGDMWTTTNRLYIRMNGNDYLVNDGSAPLGTISNNGTVL